eukprot:31000-Pelagococcus_subviridis.AAC.3
MGISNTSPRSTAGPSSSSSSSSSSSFSFSSSPSSVFFFFLFVVAVFFFCRVRETMMSLPGVASSSTLRCAATCVATAVGDCTTVAPL